MGWHRWNTVLLVLCVLGAQSCGNNESKSATPAPVPKQTPKPKSLVPPAEPSPTESAAATPTVDTAPSVEDIKPEEAGTPKDGRFKAAPAAEPVALDEKGQIQAIKAEYVSINKQLRTFETDRNSLNEGGSDVPVTLYRKGHALRKVQIDALGSFDLYSYYVEGYFKDDKLIFVMYKESTAENPNQATGQVDAWNNTQHRVYVNDGKIIRYLKKEERQLPEDKSRIQNVPNVTVRNPAELNNMSEQITEWFGAATMVSLFGNRGYPCCLTLVGKSE